MLGRVESHYRCLLTPHLFLNSSEPLDCLRERGVHTLILARVQVAPRFVSKMLECRDTFAPAWLTASTPASVQASRSMVSEPAPLVETTSSCGQRASKSRQHLYSSGTSWRDEVMQ